MAIFRLGLAGDAGEQREGTRPTETELKGTRNFTAGRRAWGCK